MGNAHLFAFSSMKTNRKFKASSAKAALPEKFLQILTIFKVSDCDIVGIRATMRRVDNKKIKKAISLHSTDPVN